MLLAVRILSYGGTWEVWRAFKKLEFLSAAPQATLTLFVLSKFPACKLDIRMLSMNKFLILLRRLSGCH